MGNVKGVIVAEAADIIAKFGAVEDDQRYTRLVELFTDVDGSFPNHHPDPAHPENLQDLIRALRRAGVCLAGVSLL